MATTGFTIGTNLFGGETLGLLLTQIYADDKMLMNGRKYVRGGFKDRLSLNKTALDVTFRPRTKNGLSPTDGTNTNFGVSDVVLDISESSGNTFEAADVFNPNDFRAYWLPFQPDGEFNFAALTPKVQAAMLSSLIGSVGEKLGALDLTGSKSNGDPYDGVITKILTGSNQYANVNVIQLSSPFESVYGTSGFNAQAVVDAFNQMKNIAQNTHINKTLYKAYSNPNFAWVVSPLTMSLFGDYQKNVQVYKGIDLTSRGVMMFDGKPIIEQYGMQENAILGTILTSDVNSNFYVGVQDIDYGGAIKVGPMANGAETWYYKVLFARDTALVRGEYAILAKY